MDAILACHPALSTEWLHWVANGVNYRIRTNPIERKCAKYQGFGLSRSKAKEILGNEHIETAHFMYNFVQKKPMQLSSSTALYTNYAINWKFSRSFHLNIRLR